MRAGLGNRRRGASLLKAVGPGDEFLAHATHELRGSLNTILGWAELLRSRPCDDQERVRAAETIIRHAHQQVWMITELVDTWRLLSGTLDLSVTPIRPPELVAAAAAAIRPLARVRGVTIDVNVEADRGRMVFGDVRRLSQALTMLLWNAAQFAAPETAIGITVGGSIDAAEIVIRDRGVGVSRPALLHLFDRRRPRRSGDDSPRGEFKMGLSLVRDVIRLHGGTIQAESDGGDSGVTFRLTLPFHPVAVPPPVADGQPAAGASTDLRGLRVLLVDDEADAREALVGILQHYGAAVIAAESAADALAALRRETVDILLADIGMPGEDGYDLIKGVRTLDWLSAHVPAVAVTAFTSEADRQRALEAGYQVHLPKPIDPSTLVATVAALGRSSSVTG